MSWGPAQIRTPRQGTKCWSAAQAEPRAPARWRVVEAPRNCQESASWESGSRGGPVHPVSADRAPL